MAHQLTTMLPCRSNHSDPVLHTSFSWRSSSDAKCVHPAGANDKLPHEWCWYPQIKEGQPSKNDQPGKSSAGRRGLQAWGKLADTYRQIVELKRHTHTHKPGHHSVWNYHLIGPDPSVHPDNGPWVQEQPACDRDSSGHRVITGAARSGGCLITTLACFVVVVGLRHFTSWGR